MKQGLEGLKVACVNVPRPLESARYRGGYCEHSGVYGFFEQTALIHYESARIRKKKDAKIQSVRSPVVTREHRYRRGALMSSFWVDRGGQLLRRPHYLRYENPSYEDDRMH